MTWHKSFPTGWHHVVASKSANNLKLYVDGELVNETMIPDSLMFNMDSTAPLKIGSGQNDIFKGQIKEVRLYNRVLKEEEIELLAKRDK
ncbi:LamG domain-containing protein [uncultured Proteiniphilum sp.]|uniref:LamG domain-containing protein n=1 Tax=uncultured Proteiniphilum sp. TaxID=497637 RepID=UPI00262B1A1E|nr:LamG domain-containing protein [uncultured Proteiniphilum sp.]